jgi:hypothetical protein
MQSLGGGERFHIALISHLGSEGGFAEATLAGVSNGSGNE